MNKEINKKSKISIANRFICELEDINMVDSKVEVSLRINLFNNGQPTEVIIFNPITDDNFSIYLNEESDFKGISRSIEGDSFDKCKEKLDTKW